MTYGDIHIIAQYFFYVYGAISVERVRVGRIAILYVTHSGTMHLILTCEMRGS
jgi:hypothetical protein